MKIVLSANPRSLVSEEDISRTVLTLAYGYSGNLSNIAGLIMALIVFIITIVSSIANVSLITGSLAALIAGSLISQGIMSFKHAKKAYPEEALKLHVELYNTNASYRKMVSTITYLIKHSAQAILSKEKVGTLLLEQRIYRYIVYEERNIVEYTII